MTTKTLPPGCKCSPYDWPGDAAITPICEEYTVSVREGCYYCGHRPECHEVAVADEVDNRPADERDVYSLHEIERFLKIMDEETRGGENNLERALYHILSQYKFELPPLDNNFHKTFRQVPVTGSSHVDSVIWHLLNESTLFWTILERVQ